MPCPTPLRIGFDGRTFSSPSGGIRRYVFELAGALGSIACDVHIFAIGASTSKPLPPGVVAVPARSWLPSNLGWALQGLPFAARRIALDVFHAPAYTAPLWGVHPLVVTIHDVSYQQHPEWYPYRRDPARRRFYRRSALAADLVITDSRYSGREIQAAYGIPPERVRVVPLGVGPPFVPETESLRRASLVAPPTILHVGDLHPRRNAGVLVDALAALRTSHAALSDTELILVGKDCGSLKALEARAEELGIARAVRFERHADDPTVVNLLRRASVFAYPSLYEGFGLPVLEAMACGTPVIASNAASIPEVVGGAGILTEPLDVKAWVDALVAVLISPERAAALRSAGLARAALFPWTRTAALTLEVYASVARRRP